MAGFSADGALLLPGFRHYSHGYAITSYSAQGKTVDRGLLLLSEAGIHAANLKQGYVSNFRSRASQAIYIIDQRAACKALQRPADRLLASELPRASAATFRSAFLHRLLASDKVSVAKRH